MPFSLRDSPVVKSASFYAPLAQCRLLLLGIFLCLSLNKSRVERLLKCLTRIRRAGNNVDICVLRHDSFTSQNRHGSRVDRDRSAAIVRILQNLNIGKFAAGNYRLNLNVSVIGVSHYAGVSAVSVHSARRGWRRCRNRRRCWRGRGRGWRSLRNNRNRHRSWSRRRCRNNNRSRRHTRHRRSNIRSFIIIRGRIIALIIRRLNDHFLFDRNRWSRRSRRRFRNNRRRNSRGQVQTAHGQNGQAGNRYTLPAQGLVHGVHYKNQHKNRGKYDFLHVVNVLTV